MIGVLDNENSARRLTGYLKRKGIENSCDVSFDATTGHMSYQIWIYEEDQIPSATAAFEEFQTSPSNAEYDVPITEQVDEPTDEIVTEEPPISIVSHRPRPYFTHFMLLLCSLVFFLNSIEEIPLFEEGLTQQSFLLTPIQAELLYDLPPPVAEIEKVIQEHKVAPGQKLETLPREVKEKLEAVDKMPFWRGFYDWFILKMKTGNPSVAEGPLFIKIREGEVWRLFSPAVLHGNLLHILFNMIWLWVLGRPIEQRIGFSKTLLLTLITGIASNTLQYLMTGPFFVGYSGVVMGLAGFIWMRERVAPWEGYPLNRATILFIVFFIGAIFALQLVSFFVELFTTHSFAPNIANTAHIAGALIGAILGRFPFFAQKAGP